LFRDSAAGGIFWIVRTFVLRAPNPKQRALYSLPIFIFATTFINIYFVVSLRSGLGICVDQGLGFLIDFPSVLPQFTKGAKKMLMQDEDDWSDDKACQIAALVALVCALVAACCLPFIKSRVEAHTAAEQANRSKVNAIDDSLARSNIELVTTQSTTTNAIVTREGEAVLGMDSVAPSAPDAAGAPAKKEKKRNLVDAMLYGMNVDIHDIVSTDVSPLLTPESQG
jgi:hypothetical protein